MMEKHPLTSKGKLAKMYFLRENKSRDKISGPKGPKGPKEGDQIDIIQADEFLKHKNRT